MRSRKMVKETEKSYLWSACECIEHVKKDETSKCHGGVARRHVALLHLVIKYVQSAAYDYDGAYYDVDEEIEVDDGVVGATRRLLEHVGIDGLHAQTLRRRSVHDNVDPEDLHRIERRGKVENGGESDQRKRRYARA